MIFFNLLINKHVLIFQCFSSIKVASNLLLFSFCLKQQGFVIFDELQSKSNLNFSIQLTTSSIFQVSWIRKSGHSMDLLTTERLIFAADARSIKSHK